MKPKLYKRIILLPIYLGIWFIEHTCGFIGEFMIEVERKAMGFRWRLDDWAWGRNRND